METNSETVGQTQPLETKMQRVQTLFHFELYETENDMVFLKLKSRAGRKCALDNVFLNYPDCYLSIDFFSDDSGYIFLHCGKLDIDTGNTLKICLSAQFDGEDFFLKTYGGHVILADDDSCDICILENNRPGRGLFSEEVLMDILSQSHDFRDVLSSITHTGADINEIIKTTFSLESDDL